MRKNQRQGESARENDRGPPRRPTYYGRARKVFEKRGPEPRAAYEAGGSYARLVEAVEVESRGRRAAGGRAA